MEAKGSCSLSEGSESGAGDEWAGVDERGPSKNWISGNSEKWGTWCEAGPSSSAYLPAARPGCYVSRP